MAKLPVLKRKQSTPTNQVTGTTLNAKPAVPAPQGSLDEVGSQRLARIQDPVPALNSRFQATQTYKKMVRGDASVRVSLRAGKAPVLGADWFFEAYDESEEAQIANEFCDFNLFHAPNIPFLKTLDDIMRMLDYGFSIVEPVYELREWAPRKTKPGANRKKYTMLKKLSARPAPTIGQFLYDDNGGPLGVEQQAIRANGNVEKVELKIEKLIIFSFDGEGGNLEGESILRSAYKHWFYKDTLYKIDAIQKERHGIGVPDIELPVGANQAEKDAAHELGANLRSNERSYIVRPPGLKVGFAELVGNPVNALESAAHHDIMIMKNVMVQFLNAGLDGSGGGRATGATAFDMFLKSMRYLANLICDYFNLYLVPKLVAYNFETDKFPKLQVRNIGEMKDLQMWAAAMKNLIDVNAITIDDDTEQFIRKVVDMPARLTPRPIAATVSNVKEQYLLRDNPDTAINEDLAGQAAITKAASGGSTATTGPGTGGGKALTGNVGPSPSSGA